MSTSTAPKETLGRLADVAPRRRRPSPTLLAAVVIGVAYLATRLYFIHKFPYFFDEGTYASFTYQAANSLHALFGSLTIGREPFQIWLGIPWVKLGFNPLTAMRIVSLNSGLLTVLVCGLLGRRLGGERVGLTAAALCVVVPFFVVHDGIGIMEPLVTLIMVTALLLQVELARRPDLRLAALLGVVLAAGVLTKENTSPAIALIPVSLLCFDWSPEDRRARVTRWLAGVVLAVIFVVAAMLLLRSSSYYSQLQAIRKTPFYTVRTLHDVIADPFAGWHHAWSIFGPAFRTYLTLPLIAAGAVGTALAVRRRPRLATLLLVWILVPLVISLSFTTLPFPRHVMYLIPPALVLIAYGMVAGARWVVRRLPARPAMAVGLVAGLALLFPALRFDERVLSDPPTASYPPGDYQQYAIGSGIVYAKAADLIRRRAVGQHVVIVYPESDSNIVMFLLGPSHRYVFAAGTSPAASQVQFALYDTLDPFVDQAAAAAVTRARLVPVAHFRRPVGGGVLTLYARP